MGEWQRATRSCGWRGASRRRSWGRSWRSRRPNPRGKAAGIERLDGRTPRGRRGPRQAPAARLRRALPPQPPGDEWRLALLPPRRRWRRPRSSAWAVLSGGGWEAVQFGGPTLQVAPTARMRRNPQLTRLGPDILAPDFDLDARGRGDARRSDPRPRRRPARPAPGRRHRQHLQERGLLRRPRRPLAAGRRAIRRGAARRARRRPRADAACGRDRRPPPLPDLQTPPGRPAPSCRGPVSSRGQGDANRTTYWCPRCQS